jgi:hypothetical protein
MAMVWDTLLVSALAEELDTLLRGARMRAHTFRWEARELALVFREGTLRWHLHPRMGWVTFSPQGEVPEDARPLSARVVAVTALPDERHLEIRLHRDRGKRRTFRVVVELMTNQWNALLLEGEEGWIRHLLWTRRLDDRTLAIGHPYSPPRPSTRRGIETPLTLQEWRDLVAGRSPEAARKALLEEVAFTSPINASFLLDTPGGERFEEEGDGSLEQVRRNGAAPGEETLAEGLRRWAELRNPGPREPCLLEFNGDKQPYPFIIKGLRYTRFSNIITAIQAVAREVGGQVDPGEEVLEELERALHRARSRVRGIRKEMAQAADPEEPRGQANLLLARLREVPRGVDSVTLTGFEGESVLIHLEPASTPQENARALYQEAARRERARDRLPALLRKAEAELRGLEDIRKELAEGSLAPREAARRIPKRKTPSRVRGQGEGIPFRRYFSSGGLEIRVGKSARDNDTLTLRHTHPDDVWLHARDRAGAHVILQWRREGSPPQRDLTEAAVLAALHSGARTSGTVPVDWTRRKYVRKPRGSPPGTVILQQSRTIFVEPDPDLPKRLRREANEEEDQGRASGRD